MWITNPLKNQKGSTLVMALIASVALALAAIFAQEQAVRTEKNNRHVRLRNLLTLREALARNLLAQANSFSCPANSFNFADCTLNAKNFQSLVELPVTGCKDPSPAGSICGIVLDPKVPGNPANFPAGLQWDQTQQTVNVYLIYNGSDVGLNPISGNVSIKLDSFTASSHDWITCNQSVNKPFLKSINPLVCDPPINTTNLSCGSGEYLHSLGATFQLDCRPIYLGVLTSGDNAHYISGLNWNDLQTPVVQTLPKLNPFSRWPNP